MAAIDRLFQKARQSGASDLHLLEGQPPRIRRVTNLEVLPDEAPLDGASLSAMLHEITPHSQWEKLESRGDARFAYSPEPHTRARVSCFKHLAGRGAVVRLIPGEVPLPQDLGLSPTLSDQIQMRSGVILLSGPTGSGISTTAASLLAQINAAQTRRILTLEDPLEFQLDGKKSMVAQSELGTHAHDFAAALREAPRAGFDVVYAGELDTREKIVQVLTCGESGILIFATLRNNSVVRALEHIANAFGTEQQHWIRVMLGNSLRCVCAQLLVPKADGSGRCVVNEILVNTTGVGSAIREGYISKLSTMIQSGGADGMMSMDDALMKKVEAGLITPAEALSRASDKNRLQQKFGQPQEPPPVISGTVQMAAAPAGKPEPAAQPAKGKPDAPPPKTGLGRFFK